MLTEFGCDWTNFLGGVFQIPEDSFFKQPIIADFLLGGANNIECGSCSARWDLYVYWVSYYYMQVCLIYGSSFRTPFQGALSSPPATPGYQLQSGPDGRGFWRVCKISRVFEHVKSPKSARKVDKIIIIIIKYSCEQRLRAQAGGTATPVPLVT